MKKLISVICVGVLMVSLTGCGNQIAKVESSTVNKEIEIKDSQFQYSTSREIILVDAKNTKIYYPKLQGYSGELSMDYMNQSIKKIADFYANNTDYSNIQLDYEVKRMDEKLVSILFKGTGKLMDSQDINIQKSVNLDVKSTNPIDYTNFIKNGENTQREIKQILDKKAKDKGIAKGFEAEGVFLYFEGDSVVFYYMPLDDSINEWVELSVPLNELDGLINTEFGERPAS